MKTSVPQSPGKTHRPRPTLADIGIGDGLGGGYRAFKYSMTPKAVKMREYRQKMREECKRLGITLKGTEAVDPKLPRMSATQDHYMRSEEGRRRAEYLNQKMREKLL